MTRKQLYFPIIFIEKPTWMTCDGLADAKEVGVCVCVCECVCLGARVLVISAIPSRNKKTITGFRKLEDYHVSTLAFLYNTILT